MAHQAYNLIQNHIKRLHEDLGQFTEDFNHERKIPPNQHLLMDVKKKEAWALGFSTPQASKKFRGNGTSMLTLQEQDLDEP